MKERLKSLFEVLDIPGGAILGMWSLLMLVMCAMSFWTGREIPNNVKDIFNWVLTSFAASKTLKTLFGRQVSDLPPQQ